MARIVCQVLHRADRITFLWSEGTATFEPYSLEGAERLQLLDLATQIHATLAAGDVASLMPLGRQLFRALFCLDSGDAGAAASVHRWLGEQAQAGRIEQIEFLSDTPGRIPWNVLHDDAASDDGRFWGTQFNLAAGRRVNILRQNPTQVNPAHVMGADRGLIEQLDESQLPQVGPLRRAEKLFHDASSLADELKHQAPDVLSLLVRFENNQLRLGEESFSIADLQGWLNEPREGNPDPLIVLMATGDGADQAAWQAFLDAATATFNGLVANEILLPAAHAFAVGQPLAERFLAGPAPVGAILRSLRQEHGAAGLAFSAFCPPQLRVASEDDTAEPEFAPEVVPLPERPYRPFAAFDIDDRALFFGREDAILRGALLTDVAATRLLVLHGAAAVGKTSYLQAGLTPYLEQECIGYHVLRDRSPFDEPVAEKDYPHLILRATNDLAGQFADALSVFCAQPFTYTTPTGTMVTVDLPRILHQAVSGISSPAPLAPEATNAIQTERDAGAVTAPPGEPAASPASMESEGISAHELWIAIRDNKNLLASVLDAITRPLPFELVIIVDQGEELLTLVDSPKQQERRGKAIQMLAALADGAARCKIIYALPSQFLGEFENLLPDAQMPRGWRPFYLPQLSEADMVFALQLPTSRDVVAFTDEIPHDKYRFTFEEGMAQQVVADAIDAAALDQQSPLPILQAVGALLYDKQVLLRKQSVIKMNDLVSVGGVREALTAYLDHSIEKLKLVKPSQRALRQLIAKLYTGHAEGALSRNLVPASELASQWSSHEPVEPIVNQAANDAGLFEIQQLMIGGKTDVYVSLPQDSLAHLGRKIHGERDLQVYGRNRVSETLWIMVPFAFFCAALALAGTRYVMNQNFDAERKEIAKSAQEFAESSGKDRVKFAYATVTRRPIYYGLIARADQALRSDNALRARQILREEPASRNFTEDTKDFRLPDLRGFEWRYLWKQLHSERFMLAGHRGPIACVAVSADGKRAATAGGRTDPKDDASIRVWDLQTGAELARLVGPESGAFAVAFSPDGKTLASAGADKLIRLWNLADVKSEFVRIEKETQTLEGHTEAVYALAYGKDEKTLISAGADKSVIIWDVDARKQKFALKEHAAAVNALGISADGKTLASGGAESQLILWDAETGKKTQSVATPFTTIAAVAFSPDGKTIAAGGVERKIDTEIGVIRFFQTADGKEGRAAIAHSRGVLSLAYRPDGEAIASGGKDFLIKLWNLKTGNLEHKWIGHYGAITSLAFAKTGDALVSGSKDATAKVWNPAQSSGPDVVQAAHADWIQCLALHSNNVLVASGARDGTVKLWHAPDARLLLKLPDLQGAVTAVAFSSHKDKIFLAASTRDDKDSGAITVWQLEGSVEKGFKAVTKHEFKNHKKGVTCLAFHPTVENADILVSGSADHTVKVWNVEAGKLRDDHKGHKDEVRCVVFTRDGREFLSGGKDGHVCIYDLDHPKDIWTVEDLHAASIESIAHVPLPIFGQNDQVEIFDALLTGSGDQSMRLWAYQKTQAGKTVHKEMAAFRPHAQPLSGLLFNPKNSGLIATCSWDNTIKLIDMFGENLKFLGNERFTFHGHTGPVRAIVMPQNQAFLVSAGNDGTIRFWRTAGDREVARAEKK